MRQSNQQRRYGFACSSCRRRKSRCNGAFPTCDRCAASRESCKYDKSPSVAYTISLQDKLKAYEEKFERLRRADSKERAAILSNSTPAPGRGSRAPSISQETHGLSPETGAVSVSNLQTTESPNETSIGLDGRVCFYGKTSLYHVEPLDDDSIERNHPGQDWRSDQSSNQNTISGDLMSCTVSEISTFADNSRTSVLSEVPIDLLNELIEVYWCWPHHLHLVLCKHLFLRDLFISGPFVTSFLLYAVLAQAARYSTRSDASQIGQGFADKALQLLPQEIDHGSSIPTIQGLLILSARECACGRTSQGWLYSGMAFRMMRDIGVHIEPKKLGHLARQFSHEEIAIRQQVFWACYTWDKTISLCLGRVPIIHDTIQLPTTDILLGGQEADDEIWKPVSGQRYQAESLMEQKALGSARFAAYCKLCIIIDGVLDTLYSRPHSAQKDHLLGYLNKTCRELENWSSSLAEGLFMQPSQKPLLCPPLHILLMNLQYHATMILLCRPYRTISSNAKRLCTEAAQMIDSLFTLHVRRFGFRFVTYLQTYTMFVAASINVCDYKENHSRWISEPHLPEDRILLAQEASARLDFGLEVLRQASSTPSAGRCAAIIAQLLQAKDPPHRASGQERQQEENCSLATRNSAENTSNEALMPNRVFTPNSLAAGLGHNAERPTQEPLQDLQPQETFEVRDNQSTRIPESEVPGPSLLPDNSHQPYLSSNDSALDGNVNYQGQGVVNSQTFSSPFQFPRRFSGPGTIETPVRWLPENMQDDGSWMLMTDTELDFGSLSNF